MLAARVDGPQPYTVGGRLALSGLVQGPNQVGNLILSPRLALTRMAYPPPEGSEVGLVATASGIVDRLSDRQPAPAGRTGRFPSGSGEWPVRGRFPSGSGSEPKENRPLPGRPTNSTGER